jgi:hypothetical protein
MRSGPQFTMSEAMLDGHRAAFNAITPHRNGQ